MVNHIITAVLRSYRENNIFILFISIGNLSKFLNFKFMVYGGGYAIKVKYQKKR